jgi:hypothetical protein
MPEFTEDELTEKFNHIHARFSKNSRSLRDGEKKFFSAYLRRRSLLGLERGDHSAEIATLTSEIQTLAQEIA